MLRLHPSLCRSSAGLPQTSALSTKLATVSQRLKHKNCTTDTVEAHNRDLVMDQTFNRKMYDVIKANGQSLDSRPIPDSTSGIQCTGSKLSLCAFVIVDRITGRSIDVCFQPGYNPLLLTGLKAPTN